MYKIEEEALTSQAKEDSCKRYKHTHSPHSSIVHAVEESSR